MRNLLISETTENIGKKVTLYGRAQTVRDHGKLLFIDLADETGILQTISREAFDVTEGDIIKVEGTVKKRPANLVNQKILTGEIELEISKLEIISKTQTPPIPTTGDGYDINEDLRLKYRYLDLRRPRLQRNLRARHKVATLAREFLNKEKFVEIETPYLSKTTPEGARDFLVPSRIHPGKFYALAQSPQQYKQLLMLAGFEKYYQFARAFRDEDMRADRQYEHTQIDIEMAYVTRENVMDLVERMYKLIAKTLGKKVQNDPFPIFPYEQALKKFSTDKFDLRKSPPVIDPEVLDSKIARTRRAQTRRAGGKNEDVLAFAWVIDFPLLEYDQKEKRYTFSHNPFCAPKETDIDDLMKAKNLDKLESYQYDLVLNGEEVGGGSIRITSPAVQKQVFKVMGFSDKRINEEFGHLLNAYNYGAPPHGGIALGLDRFCAILSGEKSIREVIAFPVSGTAVTSVMDAPSPPDKKILKELNLKN